MRLHRRGEEHQTNIHEMLYKHRHTCASAELSTPTASDSSLKLRRTATTDIAAFTTCTVRRPCDFKANGGPPRHLIRLPT